MGQMTYAVMYGCKMTEAPQSLGDEGWWEFASQYSHDRKMRPAVDYNDEHQTHFMGYWIAAGASGKDGVPKLGSFPLDEILTMPPYRKAHELAVKAWGEFASFAESRGVALEAPRLWLVQTEVA